jgi:hypothetical protein
LRRSFFRSSDSMPDPSPINPYARRWRALLAENTAIQNEDLQLISSFTPPFSARQMVQLNASAARRQELTLKLHDLVDEWAADASGGASLPSRGFPFHKAQPRPRR